MSMNTPLPTSEARPIELGFSFCILIDIDCNRYEL